MNEHPKLTCRREGHVPQVTLTITKNTAALITSYVTNCMRCGECIEVTVDKTA